MTRTIQKPISATASHARRAFLAHAAELYGLELDWLDDTGDLDDDDLDDLTVLTRAFPQLTDAERSEALWALGHFVD